MSTSPKLKFIGLLSTIAVFALPVAEALATRT
jgi:hypothetical protein